MYHTSRCWTSLEICQLCSTPARVGGKGEQKTLKGTELPLIGSHNFTFYVSSAKTEDLSRNHIFYP